MNANVRDFDSLPDSALIRMSAVTALFSLSPATIYRRVADKTFPQPKHLGVRAVRWRVGDLRVALAGGKQIEESVGDK